MGKISFCINEMETVNRERITEYRVQITDVVGASLVGARTMLNEISQSRCFFEMTSSRLKNRVQITAQ